MKEFFKNKKKDFLSLSFSLSLSHRPGHFSLSVAFKVYEKKVKIVDADKTHVRRKFEVIFLKNPRVFIVVVVVILLFS